MPLVFDATAKGASANSYCTVDEADNYFAGRLNANAWSALSNGAKEQALVAACNRLEAEEYAGTRTDTNQRLKWPRIDVPKDNGDYWDSNVVPRYVQEAQCEVALWMLNQSGDTQAPTGLEQFDQVSVGSLSVTPNHSYKSGDLPDVVKRLLRGMTFSSGGSVRLVRG